MMLLVNPVAIHKRTPVPSCPRPLKSILPSSSCSASSLFSTGQHDAVVKGCIQANKGRYSAMTCRKNTKANLQEASCRNTSHRHGRLPPIAKNTRRGNRRARKKPKCISSKSPTSMKRRRKRSDRLSRSSTIPRKFDWQDGLRQSNNLNHRSPMTRSTPNLFDKSRNLEASENEIHSSDQQSHNKSNRAKKPTNRGKSEERKKSDVKLRLNFEEERAKARKRIAERRKKTMREINRAEQKEAEHKRKIKCREAQKKRDLEEKQLRRSKIYYQNALKKRLYELEFAESMEKLEVENKNTKIHGV
mmetsp:Transcript_23843/g.38320  ORF Transcript_23843/g.38320 Transcript_23843/m.38320 type:complete len:303 (-) Transcript_23843:129-1037(-)|eukprot:jgi/Bigna1/135917/aug1.31_g10625